MRKLTVIFMLAVMVGSAIGLMAPKVHTEAPEDKKPKYFRGHKTSPNIKKLIAENFIRHGRRLKALPTILAPAYDTTTLGICPPVINQGQCGSCWDFSGVEVCTAAFLKAGYGKPDGSFYMSPQYVLDCGNNGGCNGDDNITVLAQCKATGLVTSAEYGPYQGGPGRCKSITGMQVYKIADWGFCTTTDSQGVASVIDIKNAMVAYGPIGTGVDASNFDSYTSGVMSGVGHNIDHDVLIVAWDDSKGKNGAWKVQNSWGTSWGINGYCWMEYGAYDVGTEACWASATPLPVPPPPTPPGPTPPGPVPPGPTPGATSITITGPLVVGGAVTGEILPTGTVAAINVLAAISQTQPIVIPVPTPTPPTSIEARLDLLEKMRADDRKVLLDIANSVLQLQKIGGK